MSLWYESLFSSLNGCGQNQKEKAKCILSYLSMPVPRTWWEGSLRTGPVDETHASVLHTLRMELLNAVDHGEKVSYGLLVALAFVDEVSAKSGLDTMDRNSTVDDYLNKARKILEERPDLVELGKMIDATEKSLN
jgi:hypothetical protein